MGSAVLEGGLGSIVSFVRAGTWLPRGTSSRDLVPRSQRKLRLPVPVVYTHMCARTYTPTHSHFTTTTTTSLCKDEAALEVFFAWSDVLG